MPQRGLTCYRYRGGAFSFLKHVDVSPHRRSTEVQCSRNVTDGFVSVSLTEDFADLIFADHG